MSRFIHLQPNVFVVEQTSETAHEQTSLTLKQLSLITNAAAKTSNISFTVNYFYV